MSKPPGKFYVVWHGRQTGLFATWAECERQVSGFGGARFQSFDSRAQAEAALAAGPAAPAPARPWPPPGLRLPSYSVDAACSGSPGPLEYRGVDNRTRRQVFLRGPYARGTNNVGEFLALVCALQLVQTHGPERAAVYSDSQVALGWVRAKTCRTALRPSPPNAALFAEIRQAEAWLAAQTSLAPILKWDTALWGENPADFGRK